MFGYGDYTTAISPKIILFIQEKCLIKKITNTF